MKRVRRLIWPRSLRARLALLAALGTGLMAAAIGTTVVLVLQDQLRSSSREELRDRLSATADLVSLDPSGRLRVASEELDEDAWVFDGSERIARAPGPAELQRAVAGRVGSTGFTRGPGGTLLLALPLPESGPRQGTLVGSLSLKPDAHAVDVVQALVVLTALVAVVAAGAAAHVLVGRALDPVVQLTHQAAEWSAHDVTRRFGEADRPAELADLERTLDGVLDRVAAALRHEQHLTAELSHELRTPLARISAEVELLQSRRRSLLELDRGHQSIGRNAALMEEILDTLLRTAHGAAVGARGRADASEAVGSLVGHHDDPRITVAGTQTTVGVDPAVLQRILSPLLDNACRYARDRVLVDIGPGPVIRIEDDGPGLEAHQLDAVFDPSRRADPNDGHQGAGLGLALARRLARAAGGDITLSSRPHSPGLVATVTLPPA